VSREVTEDVGGHTTGRMTGRIEVIARVSGRRAWSVEQKLAMLRDAFGPGGSVRAAVERHEVTSGLLYGWRRKAMSGELERPKASMPCFAEVEVSEPTPPVLPAPPRGDLDGRITIALPSGVRVSVDAAVDADALARVLGVLAR
jgi:transposase